LLIRIDKIDSNLAPIFSDVFYKSIETDTLIL